MWFPALFGRRHSGLLSKRSKGPTGRRRPARPRLMLEALEERCLLAGAGSAALVADILPGSASSNPANYVVLSKTLYFTANDGVHGTELYKSDGTAAGTVLVKDINPGSGDANPIDLTPVGGTLYFRADDGVHGQELWKTDGTAADTVIVKDINPGSGGSAPASSGVGDMADINGTLFISANDGVHGAELWKSNGAAAGTVMVKDVNAGSNGSGPAWLTNVNGVAFFSADDGQHGRELWKSDGTVKGTALVGDIYCSTSKTDPDPSSDPSSLINVNGTLFFVATAGPTEWVTPRFLYKTNGANTKRVSNDIVESDLLNVGGTLFFAAYNGTTGSGLYRSDSKDNGSTALVKGPLWDLGGLTNVNSTIFFVADDNIHGRELWKSDGTTAGTALVKDVYPGFTDYYGLNTSNISWLTNVNGLLYFSADDRVHGRELWQSDGTAAGTVMVQDVNPGSAASDPQDLVAMNNKLYFSADDGVHVRELWDPPAVGGYTLGPLVQVSGPSPFAAFQLPDVNAEAEPTVAVNPTNPNNAVAAWIQDFAAGIVAGVTFDGGSSWQSVVIPGLTTGSSGTAQFAIDPWLSFAPNGELYAVSQTFSPEPNATAFQHAYTGPHRIVVNTSTDGGLHWSAPATLIEDWSPAFVDDKPSITADPTNPNYAYAVWFRANANSGRHNETMFARTTDGGRTWESPRILDTTGDALRDGHQLLVQPNGTLVIVAEEEVYHGNSTQVFLSSFRSTDHGATWSAPLRGPEMVGQYSNAVDPETGQEIDNGHADYAVDPNDGVLYAVWNDTRFLGAPYDSIAFSLSSDGGLTWSAPVKINQTPTTIPVGNQEAFMPSVAVAADGTVGVTYYDLRNNTPAAGLPTDYWFIHADPKTDLTNPASWGQGLRLTNTSFNLEVPFLPSRGAFFLGDYVGLAAAGNDFVPAWVMPHTNPDGTVDLDSVFSRRIIAGDPLEAASVLTVGRSVTATPPGSQPLLPFTGHGSGGFTDAGGGFFATGIATHLGAFTHYGTLVLTPTDDPFVFAVSGQTVYQAANGDALYAVTDATLNVLTGVVAGTDTWNGGTGRFADASGVVDLSGELLPDGSVTFGLRGSIAF